MSKEAMKRALELAQEGVEIHSPNSPEYKVCAALIEALAKEPAPMQESDEIKAFQEWCFSVGLMAESYGIASVSSHVPIAEQAWKARAVLTTLPAAQPAKQEQDEPVAWMDSYRNIYSLEEKAAGCEDATIPLGPLANQQKTSGSPINSLTDEPEPDGVVIGFTDEGKAIVDHDGLEEGWALYTAPPAVQPALQPLADEEIEQCCYEADSKADDHTMTFKWTVAFARAIEAAHGIKGSA